MRTRVFVVSALVLAMSVFGVRGVSFGQVAPSMGCADVNGDDVLNVGDPVVLLRWLFMGGPPPACPGATGACGDVDGDATADVTDVVQLLHWLFVGDAEITCAVSCDNAAAPDIEGFSFVNCNAQGYPEYTHDQTGIIFVRLPGGTFNMGSPEDEPERRGDEGPVHEVTLSPFLIAKFELTQAQWKQVMGSNPSRFKGDNLPVDQVSWEDIQEFEAATALTLPTEAQWEYACKAGTQTAFSFGSGASCDDWKCADCEERGASMWYCGNSENRTHEVGTKPANRFGLHDMHGNVWEWCEDWWQPDFYEESAGATDPLCTNPFSEVRVGRGGCWDYFARACRSACRLSTPQWGRSVYCGFRPSALLP